MRKRTQNQTKTDEEKARERAEFVDFQYGSWDLVLRLGRVLSSLVFFGGVLYLAGVLHTLGYFSAFFASWLVLELPGNFFPFRVLLQLLILFVFVSVGMRIVYGGSKKKWSMGGNLISRWVGNLISRHEPHKESLVGLSLLLLSFLPYLIFFTTPPFPHPWMVTHPYWSYGLTALWMVVFVAWSVVSVLGSFSGWRNTIVIGLLTSIVVVTTWLALSFWRPLFEGYATWIFMVWWGVFFGIGVGARVLPDLTYSNRVFLLKYPIPSPRGGWGATNALPLYLAFFGGLISFSFTDGVEQGLYDLEASRSRLPIVMLEKGNPSCRQALLITSSRVYTVALQSSEPLRRLDVVPFSWEKISRIQAPEFGRCGSLQSSYGSAPVPF